MSGPIVRKYGFPNFEKIFGQREIQHGNDPAATPASPVEPGLGPIPDSDPAATPPVEAPNPINAETAGGPSKPADPRVPIEKP